MKYSKRIIVANWKMSPVSLHEAKDLFKRIRGIANELRGVETVVCPPFVFLSELSKLVTSRTCTLGAQDVSPKDEGAYTGEISARQLDRFDTRYIIVGHSERRALGETDAVVNQKIKACVRNNMRVILCVGEAERDPHGNYFDFLKKEIKGSLIGIKTKDAPKLVVAYEPIWAVGAGAKSADTPDALFEMTIFIRKILSKVFSKHIAMQTPILYGGSVGDDNAEDFLQKGGAQGLLVGRASLEPKTFSEILKIAERVK